jgi:hypothetical protein
MQIDLTKLTPEQIAIIAAAATLTAATLGGVFALTVALVNAWAAKRNERLKSHREYLLAEFRPVLDYMRERAQGMTYLKAMLEQFKAGSLKDAAITRLLDEYTGMRQPISAGLMIAGRTSPKLVEAIQLYSKAEDQLAVYLRELVKTPASLDMDRLVSLHRSLSIYHAVLRHHIEDLIFG